MSAEVAMVRKLTTALRADKPTEKVEMGRTEGVKKRWTRGIEERGAGPV